MNNSDQNNVLIKNSGRSEDLLVIILSKIARQTNNSKQHDVPMNLSLPS